MSTLRPKSRLPVNAAHSEEDKVRYVERLCLQWTKHLLDRRSTLHLDFIPRSISPAFDAQSASGITAAKKKVNSAYFFVYRAHVVVKYEHGKRKETVFGDVRSVHPCLHLRALVASRVTRENRSSHLGGHHGSAVYCLLTIVRKERGRL